MRSGSVFVGAVLRDMWVGALAFALAGALSAAVARAIVIAAEAARHRAERTPLRAANIILLNLPAGLATGALTAAGIARWRGRTEEMQRG